MKTEGSLIWRNQHLNLIDDYSELTISTSQSHHNEFVDHWWVQSPRQSSSKKAGARPAEKLP